MKKMKKAVLLLTAVIAVTLLGGCGNFDASAYVKALLDNSYKNDSAEFVAQKVGTKEQAEELYEKGIETELSSITSQVQLSDELNEEFKAVLKDVFKSVKYTVGEAEKGEDGSYTVTVNYQKMKVFAPAMEKFNEASSAYAEEMAQKAENGEDTPSEEEMNEKVFVLLKDAIRESLENVAYEDEASTTIRIELKDKVYTPNEEDVYNLELLLFDIAAVSGGQ